MAYYTKTFRKSGSHHAESSAIDGVEIKIGDKFRLPKKVSLPVGWHQKDPSDILSLTYDFTLEKKILKEAAEERAKREKDAATAAAAVAISTQNDSQVINPQCESVSQPNPVFTSVGTDILTPVTVTGSGHKRADSSGGKGTNSFDISDFEGEASTPFELVELQTINDMDVLKSVLATTMGEHPTHTSSNMSMVTTAASSGSAVMSSASIPFNPAPDNSNHLFPLSNNAATTCCSPTVGQSTSTNSEKMMYPSDLPDNTLVDVSEPSRHTGIPRGVMGMPVNSTGVLYSPAKPPTPISVPVQPTTAQNQTFSIPQPLAHGISQNPMLLDIGQEIHPPAVSSHSIPASSSTTGNTSLINQGGSTPGHRMPQGTGQLPPLQNPPPIPPRPWASSTTRAPASVLSSSPSMDTRNFMVGRMPVMPPDGGLPQGMRYSPSPSARTEPLTPPSPPLLMVQQDVPPDPSGVIRRRTAQRRNKLETGDIRRHSSPLPPIGSPEPPSDSSLPDPWPVLTESERVLVTSIAGMGFPVPRVGRAVQRLGEKDREVVDFLVAVEEVCQMGYAADSAEVALTLNSSDKTKAIEFLELEKSFKEWGFNEDNIQEALRAANNDRDKALDYLMTLSTA